MSTRTNQGWHLLGAEEVRRTWGWFLALGIVLVLLGMMALGWSVLTTLVSVVIFGWILLLGGILSMIHAFVQRRWGGFFLELFAGILYAVFGLMVVGNPAESAVALTLLIAVFLMIGGIFRIVTALTVRFHHRIWVLLNGVISLLLGLMVWSQWPVSGLWVIGLFIGIDMIFYGWSLIMLAMAVRSIPSPPV
ncbi:MAG: HdeD family acid-resistance protein [Gemmataceae bacterium]